MLGTLEDLPTGKPPSPLRTRGSQGRALFCGPRKGERVPGVQERVQGAPGPGHPGPGTTHSRRSHLSPRPQGPTLFLGFPSGCPRQSEHPSARLRSHLPSVAPQGSWIPDLCQAPGTSSPSPDATLSSGKRRCWAPQKGEPCGSWPSPRPRAALPPQGEAAPEPQENWMGRASGVCPQARTPAPRPLRRILKCSLNAVSGIWPPPPLPPSQTREDSISPCWGELESQPGGEASSIIRPTPGGAPPGLAPEPRGDPSIYHHTPTSPGRSGCKGNLDHRHLEGHPSDPIWPRWIAVAFHHKGIKSQGWEMSFPSHRQMPLGSFCSPGPRCDPGSVSL